MAANISGHAPQALSDKKFTLRPEGDPIVTLESLRF
jgi:hypothetical protein